ncbi:MAG: hypothetical protein Q4F95_01725 [Oscillospiraceae bacterium]|nr:hypothetical protein [Oscillospiraceae bacterium]
MNEHNVPYNASSRSTAYNMTDREQQFCSRYTNAPWHPITEYELQEFRKEFKKRDLSADLSRPVIQWASFSAVFILLCIGGFKLYSVSAVLLSIAAGFVITAVLYLRDKGFVFQLSQADVCIIPVYETANKFVYNKHVKHEVYYASAFYEGQKKEFPLTMSSVGSVTDIMLVSAGGRMEFMPLSVQEHLNRYRHSGIFLEYCETE